MLRMSPPLGDMLRLGDEAAEGRALLVKRAKVMEVDTVSAKAFPEWSDGEAREARAWLDDNGLRMGEVVPFYQGRHLGFHDPALHKIAIESYSYQIHISAILGAAASASDGARSSAGPRPTSGRRRRGRHASRRSRSWLRWQSVRAWTSRRTRSTSRR